MSVENGKIGQLIPDNLNANAHTEVGMNLLSQYISKLGLGRSIVVDKNNRVIGGNGVLEAVSELGIEDTIVVSTTGKQLVVVKREDVDLDSEMGRSLAIADNAVARVNLSWDKEALGQIKEKWGINAKDWGALPKDFNVSGKDDKKEKGPKNEELAIIISCTDQVDQRLKIEHLSKLGYSCKNALLISGRVKIKPAGDEA